MGHIPVTCCPRTKPGFSMKTTAYRRYLAKQHRNIVNTTGSTTERSGITGMAPQSSGPQLTKAHRELRSKRDRQRVFTKQKI
jgi:hypothetical protein